MYFHQMKYAFFIFSLFFATFFINKVLSTEEINNYNGWYSMQQSCKMSKYKHTELKYKCLSLGVKMYAYLWVTISKLRARFKYQQPISDLKLSPSWYLMSSRICPNLVGPKFNFELLSTNVTGITSYKWVFFYM